jgi:hypothetical protein
MTYEEKIALREMRDEIADEADKKLLRKAVSYIYDLEHKLTAIRVFAKAIDAEAKIKGEEA